MISPKTKGAIRILIELRLQGRRPALSALSLLCCTRVGISRQSAAVPRLCPLLRVVGLTEQLIAGHEGPALVPDGTLACPGPAVRQRPTGATWARAMSLAALLQKDIMLAYIYSSRTLPGLAGVSCASFLLADTLDIRCWLIRSDVAAKDSEQQASIALCELAEPADQLANHADILCVDMLIVFELSNTDRWNFTGITGVHAITYKKKGIGIV